VMSVLEFFIVKALQRRDFIWEQAQVTRQVCFRLFPLWQEKISAQFACSDRYMLMVYPML
jgi:hypothetical protein